MGKPLSYSESYALGTHGAARKAKQFSNPFILPSDASVPETFEDALDLCLYLFYLNPQYRAASLRVVSHFVTDIDFEGDEGDSEERKNFKKFFKEDFDILGVLMDMGAEVSCYGNAFYRLHFPFDRMLVDNRTGDLKTWSLDVWRHEAKFYLEEMKYEVPDPLNGGKGTVKLDFVDMPSTDLNRIKAIKLEPRNIRIRRSRMSGATQILYRWDPKFKNDIKNGVLHEVNETPQTMLKAIAADKDFLFNKDQVFYYQKHKISDTSDNGWNIPPVIENYRSIHQLQVYKKIDEAVGYDYMLPFRLFSPEHGTQNSDPTKMMDMALWQKRIKEIIQKRREDPFAMHASATPVKYQEFGANGKQLTPKDLIEFQTNDMLDGLGYPAELFRGTLKVEQVPTTMRIFENTFEHIPKNFNNFVKWSSRKILSYLKQPVIDVSLQKPSMADNIEKMQIRSQLVASGEIPRAAVYREYGIEDPVAAAKQRIDEDLQIERAKAKSQAEFERELTLGSIDQVLAGEAAAEQEAAEAAGGAGMGGAGGGSRTGANIGDVMQQAQEIAAQLLQIPDVGTRRKELQNLQATNPTLHAAVKESMENMRSQAASQGRAQVGEMMAQG